MTTLRWAFALWGGMGACAALAQSLPDPTRPPFVARAGSKVVSVAPAEAPMPVLQSVLIGKDRRMAIISGQRFDIGDQVGDARIVRITETEVLLRSGAGHTTLKLFPQVLKRTKNNSGPGTGAAPNANKKSAMLGVENEA